jgi:hypothetical protein
MAKGGSRQPHRTASPSLPYTSPSPHHGCMCRLLCLLGFVHALVLQTLVVVVHSNGQHLQSHPMTTPHISTCHTSCSNYKMNTHTFHAALLLCGRSTAWRLGRATAGWQRLKLHNHTYPAGLTFFAGACPITQSSSLPTISLGVGMSRTPQFMVAEVPLKFWPPYCV